MIRTVLNERYETNSGNKKVMQ